MFTQIDTLYYYDTMLKLKCIPFGKKLINNLDKFQLKIVWDVFFITENAHCLNKY